MKTGFLIALFFLGVIHISMAQETDNQQVSPIAVQDAFIQTGFISGGPRTGTIEDFKALAKQSVFLNSEIWDFSRNSRLWIRVKGLFSAQLGLRFRDHQKTAYKSNPLLRLGITYSGGTIFSGDFEQEEVKTSDTLISGQTGETYVIDSVTRSNITMRYKTQLIQFDANLLFRTNPQSRWSVYGGIGITAGASLNANTEINYYSYLKTEMKSSDGTISSYYSDYDRNKREVFSNGSTTNLTVYIPLGIDFRLARRSEFWKRLHIFYEMRPGIETMKIPELRTYSNGTFQNSIGFRVAWE